jgi:predicted patatin/cPLA2 family phospholipase
VENLRIGLVLEGGGMRGVYTAGVLEYFLEEGIRFPHVVGVSAGACSATNYLSEQRGRNRTVTIGYVNHPHYLSVSNWFRERSLFGMNFLFNELPNRLVPFDYEAFFRNPAAFWVVTTDAMTGEPCYREKNEAGPDIGFMDYVRASSSLPYVSPPVHKDGRILFDGGVSDPIPVGKSERDGNEFHVIVLTREAGYRKTQGRNMRWLARRIYPEYGGLHKAMERRWRVYNESLERAERLEKEGRAVILRPPAGTGVDRMTKDERRLSALYELGYRHAKARADVWRRLF